MTGSTRLLAIVLACVSACAATHEIPPPADDASLPPPPTDAFVPPTPDAGPPAPLSLEQCLLAGGTLRQVGEIDNNDMEAHGAVRAFGISPDRRLGLAGDDGSVKLWTLTGFLGSVSTTQFLYGPVSPTATANDLTFHGDRVVIGDVNGLVSEWDLEGGMNILGGTTPDTAITAIALDSTQAWLAQADVTLGGAVTVRQLGGTTVIGPMTSGIQAVARLAYLDDGRLLVAGGTAGVLPPGGPDLTSLEIRDASDPQHVLHSFTGITISDVSIAGSRIATTSAGTIQVFDDELTLQPTTELRGVAELSLHGSVLFVLDIAGVLHALRPDATELTQLVTARGAWQETGAHDGWSWLRRDPQGDLILAAYPGEAHVVAFGCQ